MGLRQYIKKRNFDKTPEPKGRVHSSNTHRFYIQKHAASHLHYDFRLELNGVLKSWAVPKGPSLNPKTKRLAMHVEDHPLEYGTFEGIIPKGEYGGGTVMLWDEGIWEPLDEDPLKAYKNGHLRFNLHAQKLNGRWDLIHFKKEDNSWFLIKYEDKYADSATEIVEVKPLSVLSQQTIEEIAENYNATWTKTGLKKKSSKKLRLNLPKSIMPEKVSAQLATLVDKPPYSDEWLHEVKFDGYRILAFKDGKNVKLISRNQNDWTNEFQSIADAIKLLPVKKAIFDGEIVLLDENNRSNFQLLQNSIKERYSAAFIYYMFDLLYYETADVRSLSLIERKKILASILSQNQTTLRYSDHIVGHGNDIFKHSCEFNLEGIVSKQCISTYIGSRSKSWLKVKCLKRQEFVVGGFTSPKHSRRYFGSLFLGLFDQNGCFIFSGNVGTGFTEKSLKEVYIELKKRVISTNPFNSSPPGITTATWVKPEIVVEIEFTEWTQDGRLRHPSFKGLRLDKQAKDVIKEIEEPVKMIEKPDKKENGTVTLTHPEKELYKEDHITKKELFDYYHYVSTYILPFISHRPLTLVRCPSEYTDCFYQKKINDSSASDLHPIAITSKESNKRENYIYLENETGLLQLVQMSVLEIHPWGSLIEALEYPDMITIDLDPSPDMPWSSVVSAAFDVKKRFAELKLKAFVKTTGGKGLHVVVPIMPDHDWDKIKQFTHSFVDVLEQMAPDRYVTVMSKAKRKGKIFMDYLRNQRGATAIAAYSTRARLHAPVSTPIDWDELTDDIRDTYFTIKTLPLRLKHLKKDPWGSFWEVQQSLKLSS